ncbi:hypothetical protein LVB77_02700 [Lysobacter sp. 5GHs7-4]|uniref:hypothetical protein n=1 Tax=Lysobacter sp. 5GHs7-4 TaxID=2904253 RepID=UPI001E4D4E26|nr:hypothetical protein [Lysobacter sp. 5GHs7-4]UHQ23646.1 hypothetical protein LVB77_02700 [Lysobacter sp. 5GHs7-4]
MPRVEPARRRIVKMSLVWTPALMPCVASAATANVGLLGQILQEQRQIRAASERATGRCRVGVARAIPSSHRPPPSSPLE